MIQAPNPSNPQNNNPPKKPRKPPITLKPQYLEKKNGLRSLYQMTKEINLDKAEINIENTMKKVVSALKTWHFGLIPKYSYPYFLQRCQALGNEKIIQGYMAKVRRIHQGIQQWDNEGDQQKEVIDAKNQIENFNNSINVINQIVQTNQINDENHQQQYMQLLNRIKLKEKKKIENKSEDEGVQIESDPQLQNYDDYYDDQ